MPKYDIKRWDVVIPKGNDHPVPMIYVKPDEGFVKYAQENDYQVLVDITGTGTVYDKKPILAVIDSSGYFPDYRPYFYNKTGYFVLTLFTKWDGYPNTGNGSVLIRGLKGPDKVTVPEEVPYEAPKPTSQALEPFKQMVTRPEEGQCGKMTSSQIGWTLTGILIVFGVLLYISYNNKNTVAVQ